MPCLKINFLKSELYLFGEDNDKSEEYGENNLSIWTFANEISWYACE
jgi:hypothetical protein